MEEMNGMSYAVIALGERICQLEKDLRFERALREHEEGLNKELESENRRLKDKLKAYIDQMEV